MLIYLADAVHSHAGRLNPDTVPYNVARIAAYAQSRHPEHEYRIFKDPHVLLDAIRTIKPDMLALSHYFWNTQLIHRIARYARELYPDITIVTGGPNLDRDKAAYIRYSQEHPYINFVIIEEGETAFANILSGATTPPGTFSIRGPGEIWLSATQPRVRDLDEFPSPYLSGMLDPFLEMGLRPILETVRGCPYRCAFCEQGSEFFTKIAPLSMDRVTAELDYIRSHQSAEQLILADVNFGILKRDLDVATLLKQSHEQHGWPHSLYVYNAKQPTETTLRTMETLYPMAQLCMSFQSTDKTVLENIHRSNIGYDKYSFITQWAKKRDLPVGTELIYGLPGETRQSFVDGYETLLNFRADYMASYNLRLFPGIELNSPEKRAQYDVKTRFRPMDVHLGEYQFKDRERILEIEEIVLSNSTLTEDDYFHVRKLAFLVEALWNTGYLRPALAFLANHDFKITKILEDILHHPSSFFEEYDRLVHEELSEQPDFSRWNWDDLVSGKGANLKVNLAFAGRLLLFTNPFDDFFYNYLHSLMPTDIFLDVLAHCRASKLEFDDPEPRQVSLGFDVPAWIKATYPLDMTPFMGNFEYTYSLDPHILASAHATEARLRYQGANLNHIAERIFMEVPASHRGTRTVTRNGLMAESVKSEDLEQRMTWAG